MMVMEAVENLMEEDEEGRKLTKMRKGDGREEGD